LLRRDVGIAMDANLGIAGLFQPLKDNGERFIGIDKYTVHGNSPVVG
jgi:hypothetical protein